MAAENSDLDRRHEEDAQFATRLLRKHIDDIVRQPLTGRMRDLLDRLAEKSYEPGAGADANPPLGDLRDRPGS